MATLFTTLFLPSAAADGGTLADPTHTATTPSAPRFIDNGTPGSGSQQIRLLVPFTPDVINTAPQATNKHGYNQVIIVPATDLVPASDLPTTLVAVYLCPSGTAALDNVISQAPASSAQQPPCVGITKNCPTPGTGEYCDEVSGSELIVTLGQNHVGAALLRLTLKQQANLNPVAGTTVTVGNSNWVQQPGNPTPVVAGRLSPPASVPFETVAGVLATLTVTCTPDPATVGAQVTCTALGMDASTNPQSNTGPIVWTAVTSTGKPVPITPTGVFVAPVKTSESPITVTANAAQFSVTGTDSVALQAGPVAKIRINDASGPAGQEVLVVQLQSGATTPFHAASYDLFDNFIANPSTTWDVTTVSGSDCGTLLNGAGASKVFTATLATVDQATPVEPAAPVGCQVKASFTSGDSTFEDSTGPISVSQGALASLKILDKPDNKGDEVAVLDPTADALVALFAAGYDAQGNYLGDQDALWIVITNPQGTLCGTVTPGSGPATVFNPSTIGTSNCRVRAAVGIVNDETGVITVATGQLAKLKIRTLADGLGSELTQLPVAAGSTTPLHAAGYDADDNYKADQASDWTVVAANSAQTCGTPTSATGVTTIPFFASVSTGPTDNCRLLVRKDASSASLPIQVTGGPVAKVVIRDAAAGAGSEVVTFALDSGQTKQLFAATYNGAGGFLGDAAPAVWTVETSSGFPPPAPPSLGPPCGTVSAPGATATFTGTKATGPHPADLSAPSTPINCRVKAVASSVSDETGPVIVRPSTTLASLEIRDRPGKQGAPVETLNNLNADQVQPLAAAGYDAQGNYLGDQDALWIVITNPQGTLCGTVTPGSGPATVFNPSTIGTSNCRVRAAVGSVNDETGVITVTPGAPINLTISLTSTGSPWAGGPTPVTQTTQLYAVQWDRDGNVAGNPNTANWAVVNGCGTLSASTGSSVFFDPTTVTTDDDLATPANENTNCRVRANLGSSAPAAAPPANAPAAVDSSAVAWTGVIEVNPASLPSLLKIRSAANNGGVEIGNLALTAGQAPTFWAAGYDADFNYIGDQTATWTSSDANKATVTSPDASTTFTPLCDGSVTVTALVGAVSDATGTISVTGLPDLRFTGSIPASPTAGAAFSLTVTAYTTSCSVDTTYGGTVRFTSTDAQAVLPPDYPFQPADAGVKTFTSGFQLKTAGSRTITVSDTANADATDTTPAITVGPSVAATMPPTGAASVIAGAPYALTLTAKDAFGNTATLYTGSKSVTITGANLAPDLNAPTCGGSSLGVPVPVLFVSGAAPVTCSFFKAETASLTGTAPNEDNTGTIPLTPAKSVTVNPAAASTFILTIPPGQAFQVSTGTNSGSVTALTAGTSFAMQVRALDAFLNVVGSGGNNFNGEKTLTFSGPANAHDGTSPTATNNRNVPIPFGTGTALTFTTGLATPTVTLFRSGAGQLITATASGGPSGTSSTAVVNPDNANPKQIGIVRSTAACDPAAGGFNPLTYDRLTCILASESVNGVANPLTAAAGDPVTLFAAQFDDWDNIIGAFPVAEQPGLRWEGAGSASGEAGPCLATNTATFTCPYANAGQDEISVTKGSSLRPAALRVVVT